MEDNNVYHEDEIDLKDLLLVVWRYRKIIIGFFLIPVIISAVFSFFVLRPIYQVEATVSLGYLSPAGANPINPLYTNPDYAKQILSSDEFLTEVINQLHLDAYTSPNSFSQLKKTIVVDTDKGTNMLQLTIQTKKPDEGRAILATMLDIFGKTSNLEFERQLSLIENDNQRITQDIDQTNQKIKNAEDAYASLENAGTDINANLQRSELLDTLSRLEDERQSLLNEQIAEQQEINGIHPMQLVQHPWNSQTPVGPHKMLNITIAGILGLMLGVFVAFTMDYFKRNPIKLQ